MAALHVSSRNYIIAANKILVCQHALCLSLCSVGCRMSIMTTRRRSSHATGSQKNHSSSTFTLHDPHLNDTSTSFTARPLPVASSIELMQSSTYPLHLVQQSTNRHPQTRFTLHQILTVAISIAFVTPKFIEVFRGRPLTLSFLDLILAILQLTSLFPPETLHPD